MRPWVLPAAALTALGWAVLTATAQTAGTPVETPSVPLPPAKQAIVKEHVARTRTPLTEVPGPVMVGMTVPDTVELFGLPQDTVTEVPAVTRYRFFVAGNIIAVVSPRASGSYRPFSGERCLELEGGSIMAAITRDDVREVLGSVEDIVIAEIIASGASREELTQARAWLEVDEVLLNEGRPLPSGRVQGVLSILQAAEHDRQELQRQSVRERVQLGLAEEQGVALTKEGRRVLQRLAPKA